MHERLLIGREVDRLLRLAPGESARLAREGLLPHVLLPDGCSVRFRAQDIERLMNETTGGGPAKETAACA